MNKDNKYTAFSHNAIDRFFRFLEYILIVSALYYLSELSGHILLRAIFYIAYFFLYVELLNLSSMLIDPYSEFKLIKRHRLMVRMIVFLISTIVTSGLLVSINTLIYEHLLIK